MAKNKIVVAMSGGVDSSVAAGLLVEQGYDIIGITMNLFSLPKDDCLDGDLKGCCGWGAVEDASRVASKLGISHTVLNLKESFEDLVVSNFLEEYSRGRTPNPCIRCNKFIKFDVLMEKAKKIGASYIATGHHAQIVRNSQTGHFFLKKGKDKGKDQSYFLYTMTQDQLSRTLFPVGSFTKAEVRKQAQEWGLPVADRPESQEICFVPDNDISIFSEKGSQDPFIPVLLSTEKAKFWGTIAESSILPWDSGEDWGLQPLIRFMSLKSTRRRIELWSDPTIFSIKKTLSRIK